MEEWQTWKFRPIILEDIRKAQEEDEYLAKVQKFDEKAKKREFKIASEGIVRFKGKIYVPEMTDLREQLTREAQETPYSVHPSIIKDVPRLKEKLSRLYMIAILNSRRNSMEAFKPLWVPN